MERKQTYPALTGLKGIAIFFIIFYHTLELTPLIQKVPASVFLKVYGGILGNYLFFLISGFLMACNYRDRIRTGEVTFGAFLVRRLRRFYPLYLISNLVMLGIYLLRDGLSALDLNELLLVLTLQAGSGLSSAQPYNYPTWFISALFLCNILYYAITCHAKTGTQYRCAVAAMLVVGYILMRSALDFFFLYTPNGMTLITFFSGVIIAEVYPALTDHRRKQMVMGCFAILAVVGFLGVYMGFHMISSSVGTLFGLLICPEIMLIALACRPVSRVFQWKPVQFLGKISTSVFFWHIVIFELFSKEVYGLGILPEMYEVRYVLYLLVVILLSWLSEYVMNTYLPRRARRRQGNAMTGESA